MSTERVAVDTTSAWPGDAEDVEEGVVVTWFVREGTHVEREDTLCEIQIEKVSVDVLAPETGELVEIVLGENDEFERGDTLAWIQPE
jgi:pyruvate/2-oxoglutarate dehydrogenase complex dihydrolipoamide acyltransferase (E2) component